VLERIRSDRVLEETPVIMLSASAGHDYMERARDGGANVALTKPLLPDELLQAIRAHAGERRHDRIPG